MMKLKIIVYFHKSAFDRIFTKKMQKNDTKKLTHVKRTESACLEEQKKTRLNVDTSADKKYFKTFPVKKQ